MLLLLPISILASKVYVQNIVESITDEDINKNTPKGAIAFDD